LTKGFFAKIKATNYEGLLQRKRTCGRKLYGKKDENSWIFL